MTYDLNKLPKDQALKVGNLIFEEVNKVLIESTIRVNQLLSKIGLETVVDMVDPKTKGHYKEELALVDSKAKELKVTIR